MAILLFNLRDVPEDEAFEVRDLLSHHEIDFYETNAGNWGMSLAAMCLHNDTQLLEAQKLLATYEQYRYNSQREAYLKSKAEGKNQSLWQSFRQKPLLFGVYVVAMSLVVYISIKMLFEFGFSL